MSSLTGENIIFVNILDVIDDGQIQVEGESPPDCVLTNDEFGILTWLPVGDLPQPPQPEPGAGYDAGRNISQELLDTGIIATLDDVEFAGVEIDGDYPYGLSVPSSGIECSGALGVKTGLLNIVGVSSGVPKFQIDGVSGTENQIITFDVNDGLKFGSVGGDGLLTAGDNIDPAQLLTGVIAVERQPSFQDVYITGSSIALDIPSGGIRCNGRLGITVNTIDYNNIIDTRTGDLIKAHIEINNVKGTNNQIIVSDADGAIRWDTVDNIYTPPVIPPTPTPDPDTTIVKFIDVEVRAGRWQRILDCRLSKGGKTSTNQVFIKSIDMRPYTANNSNPFAYWYFRQPRNIDEVVHFDFKYLKDNVFIPYPVGSAYIYPVSCGFKNGGIYTIIGNVILHSTASTDLYFQLPSSKVFRGFSLFYQNTTGWIAGGALPNHSALPCNLDCDIKLFYEEGSNVVTVNIECWTDITLGTEAQYTLGNNTAMTTDGIINNLYN